MRDREYDNLIRRLVIAVERLAGIEAPKPEEPAKSAIAMRDRVSVVRRVRMATDEPDDRGLTRGGTPPEQFFSRKD